MGEPLKNFIIKRNEEKNKKVDSVKAVQQTMDFITYGTMAAIGLFCVHGYYGIPTHLGGTGNCTTVGWEWPTPKFHPGMRIYSIVQHGYHIRSKLKLYSNLIDSKKALLSTS